MEEEENHSLRKSFLLFCLVLIYCFCILRLICTSPNYKIEGMADVSDPAIVNAYNDVRSDSSDTDW